MDRWPALLKRKEAAEYLSMGTRQFSLLIAGGEIRGVKMHPRSQPRYKRSDLDEYIESLEYGQGYCAATQSEVHN